MIWLTILLLLGLAALDYPGIIKRSRWEQAVWVVLMTAASAYVVAMVLDWEHTPLLEVIGELLEGPATQLRKAFGLR